MIVYCRGQFVREDLAVISAFDRGFLYGDGVFETMRVYSGRPFLWTEHMERFLRGTECVGITSPLSPGEMRTVVERLIGWNRADECVVRIVLSRGRGVRGYSPRGANEPTLVISAHELPAKMPGAYKVICARETLNAGGSLARIKHCNRLKQVLARAEADEAGVDEALMLNDRGSVIEGTSTNLFWVEGEAVCTAPEAAGALPGTTRGYVMALARETGMAVKEKHIRPEGLKRADGVFVTSSVVEIMPVSHLDGVRLSRSAWIPKLQRAYRSGVVTAGD